MLPFLQLASVESNKTESTSLGLRNPSEKKKKDENAQPYAGC